MKNTRINKESEAKNARLVLIAIKSLVESGYNIKEIKYIFNKSVESFMIKELKEVIK